MDEFKKSASLWLDRFLVPLDDPGSRLFHLNIFIAFALVLGWILLKNKKGSLRVSLRRLVFRKRYWWNKSTRLDYQFYILNSILKVFLLIPLLDFSFSISRFVSSFMVDITGDFAGLNPTTGLLVLFTTIAFVWDDFLRFGHHWLMHRVPFLWRVHSIHHSARILTPVTLFRNHPLESAIATVRNSLSLGVMAGLFIFLFEARLNLITLFGVNMFGFLFNLLGANLRHSHIPISFGNWAESFFISPLQHQVHHSRNPDHFNKNYGVSLALWDRMSGSLIKSKSVGPLSFGIEGRRQKNLIQELLLHDRSS
jgi:sterol desaturase/sphingolipid hydroxylase (fatty acid hydroxylase superfamily)